MRWYARLGLQLRIQRNPWEGPMNIYAEEALRTKVLKLGAFARLQECLASLGGDQNWALNVQYDERAEFCRGGVVLTGKFVSGGGVELALQDELLKRRFLCILRHPSATRDSARLSQILSNALKSPQRNIGPELAMKAPVAARQVFEREFRSKEFLQNSANLVNVLEGIRLCYPSGDFMERDFIKNVSKRFGASTSMARDFLRRLRQRGYVLSVAEKDQTYCSLCSVERQLELAAFQEQSKEKRRGVQKEKAARRAEAARQKEEARQWLAKERKAKREQREQEIAEREEQEKTRKFARSKTREGRKVARLLWEAVSRIALLQQQIRELQQYATDEHLQISDEIKEKCAKALSVNVEKSDPAKRP
jgi:flagellar biosynthesis GTPase FlhF